MTTYVERRRLEVAELAAARPTYWRTFRADYRKTTSLAGDAVHLDGCPVIARTRACLPWRLLDGQPAAAVLEAVAVDPLLNLCAVCWRPSESHLPGETLSSELALPTTRVALTFDQQLTFADKMAKATSLPPAYRDNPGNLLFAAQFADMFGLHPITVIRYADFVEGRLTPGADLQIALVRRAGHTATVWTEGEGDTVRGVCEIIRRDNGIKTRVVFSLDDAKRAGLATKNVWKNYPRRMTKHRAVTEAVSDACSEVLMGLEIPLDLEPTAAMLGLEEGVADAEVVETPPAAAAAPLKSVRDLRGDVWTQAERLWPDLDERERMAEVESEFALINDGLSIASAGAAELTVFVGELANRVAPGAGK